MSLTYSLTSTYHAHIAPVYMHYNNGVYFNVYGTYMFYSQRYYFDKLVSINFREDTNYHSVYVDNP